MDLLKQSAESFENLLDKEYALTIARKRQKYEFRIIFEEWDFKHLSGIQKLIDLDLHSMPAGVIFNDILHNKITERDLQESLYFNDIKERLENLKNLENYLDNNMLVFKWDEKKAAYSKIKADYMLKEDIQFDNKAYIFLKEKTNIFCSNNKLKVSDVKKESAVSFFLSIREYNKNQVSYILLRNEKIDLRNNKRILLFDRCEVIKSEKELEKVLRNVNMK
jgi:hypothetical protein